MSLRVSLYSVLLGLFIGSISMAQEFLVGFVDSDPATLSHFTEANGGQLSLVSAPGHLYKWVSRENRSVRWTSSVSFMHPNHKIRLYESPSLIEHRAEMIELAQSQGLLDSSRADTSKPDFAAVPNQSSGTDPQLSSAWGMFFAGADAGWKNIPTQGKGIIVAVTDTGFDYNHEDLIANVWRNPKETMGDGADNDGNGYVDDIVGWDFTANDNKPYDIVASLTDILMQGGNPGHGTHVSGVIGARHDNSLGTSGVAPQVQIMGLRFIDQTGQGTTENAIKAIDYAVANGAKLINASWGSEAGDEDDTALKQAIQRAEAKGVLFVVAAGNGRADSSGMPHGFDNDNDPKPIVPASYPFSNVVCVAAIDSAGALAAFSNWGKKSVKLGAPGVKILSTVPGNKYQDTVIDMGPFKATWDGTSMATPFVTGALAAVWSAHMDRSAQDVVGLLLSHTKALPSLSDKVVTGGALDLSAIH